MKAEKSSRELFENVRANEVFFLVFLDFGWVLGPLHQFVSRYASHLYRDTFAKVLGSGVVGTPPISRAVRGRGKLSNESLDGSVRWVMHGVDHFLSETKVCTGDFAPPEPEFRAEFWETNFGRPNFGPEFSSRIFWLCFFQQKRPPEKFTLEKFTSRNSHRKIHPRIWAEKFTLYFCRAILLTSCLCIWWLPRRARLLFAKACHINAHSEHTHTHTNKHKHRPCVSIILKPHQSVCPRKQKQMEKKQICCCNKKPWGPKAH